MTNTISPFLRNQLNANRQPNNDHHEKIYENLKQHANDVKPNEAKAKLVQENPIQKVTSAIKDNYNDGKNFFKATKTGKMNDNNLGRINDLGMKAGALLIATFLATHAKTKTEAIMQFIGGTTFFASMALWPKLFINLPARIIHGFPIGEKYISAQGDKKDLYLDNQFIPTGIHSKEQIEREMKRMGIDPNEKNAEEKWFRKRQKTALQNRTLWMATAGFSTPLMTALIGNYVQPKVENAVIEHDFKKANKILSDDEALNAYFLKQQDLGNAKKLTALLNEYSNKELTEDFYTKLVEVFKIDDILDKLKNPDDKTPLSDLKSSELTKTLIRLHDETSTIENLEEALKKPKKINPLQLTLGGAKSDIPALSDDNIRNIATRMGDNGTPQKLKEILKEYGLTQNQENEIFNSLKTNNENFFKAIVDYNTNVFSKIRGRIKAYLDLLNPIAGSKSESVDTRQYNKMMKELAEKLGIKDYKDLKSIKQNTSDFTQSIIQKQIIEIINRDTEYEQGLQKFVDLTSKFINSGKQDSESFEKGLKEAFGQDFPLLKDKKFFDDFKWYIEPLDASPDRKTWLMQIFEDYCNSCPNAPKRTSVEFLNLGGFSQVEKEAAQKLADTSTIMKIFNITPTNNEYSEILGGNGTTQAITSEILGGKESRGHLFNQLSKYLKNKKTNIDFARAKALICANFERRVKEGMFEPFGEEGIKAARDLLYNGTISTTFNNGHIANKQTYQNLINAIFNKEVFKTEEKAMPGILNIIEELKKIPSGTNFTEETLKANSLADQTKSFITRIYNNKTWMKIFAPMAIGLVAVTLLAQPFFGKIKKEFPENEKSGGTK